MVPGGSFKEIWWLILKYPSETVTSHNITTCVTFSKPSTWCAVFQTYLRNVSTKWTCQSPLRNIDFSSWRWRPLPLFTLRLGHLHLHNQSPGAPSPCGSPWRFPRPRQQPAQARPSRQKAAMCTTLHGVSYNNRNPIYQIQFTSHTNRSNP